MATTTNKPRDPAALEDQGRLVAWLRRNQKLVSYGLTALAVIAVAGWLWRETSRRKAAAGAVALEQAQTLMEMGNLTSAATEFQRVIRTYGGTDAAFQAELGANTVRLAMGQTQIARDELRKFVGTSPPAFFAAGGWAMLAGALENLKQYDSAASAYRQVAALAPEDYRKVDGLLGAARANRLAGKPDQAIEIFRQIIAGYSKETPGVAEAVVRLAEATQGRM